ncbi:LOW QUALITY PROTEIN: fibronectin-like [Diadema antillarum]|uniref:LOW QUALITY PROTEIN: fibronectin-like n=1 Tax=Diadema antillarum TaxID=105358 RepID=UPI003A8B232C
MTVNILTPTLITIEYDVPGNLGQGEYIIEIGRNDTFIASTTVNSGPLTGSAFFQNFPNAAPGDLLYAQYASSSNPDNVLNRIRHRIAPSPPRSVVVSPASLDSASVSFELPSTGSYDGFRIRVNDVLRMTLSSSETSAVIDGLSPNTPYTFTLTSFIGRFSDEEESTVESATISLGPYSSNEPHIFDTTNTSLTVIWVNAETDGRQVCLTELCSTLSSGSPSCLPTNSTCPIFFTFDGLVPGRRYVVSVELSSGETEDILYTQTEPNPPDFFNVTSLGSDRVQVLLAPPKGDFDGYMLTFSPDKGSVTLSPEETEYTLDGLADEATYTVEVVTFTRSGLLRIESEPRSLNVTTSPAVLSAANIMSTELILTWSSDGLNENALQYFRLEYSSMVSGSRTIQKNTDPNNDYYAFAITGLIPGDLVTMVLRAEFGSGLVFVDEITRRTGESPHSSRLAFRCH